MGHPPNGCPRVSAKASPDEGSCIKGSAVQWTASVSAQVVRRWVTYYFNIFTYSIPTYIFVLNKMLNFKQSDLRYKILNQPECLKPAK